MAGRQEPQPLTPSQTQSYDSPSQRSTRRGILNSRPALIWARGSCLEENVSKKSALARKREAQEAKSRRKRRLVAVGIGTAVVVVVAAMAIVYFAVHKNSSPEAPQVT